MENFSTEWGVINPSTEMGCNLESVMSDGIYNLESGVWSSESKCAGQTRF